MINRRSLRSLPYILATGVTVSLAAAPAAADGHLTATAPKGASVWIAPSGDTYQLLRLWRSGDRLRLYRDEGNYPGDGVYCAWGSLDGKRFTGKEQRVAPDPLPVRYTIKREGRTLRVAGLTGLKADNRLRWRRGTIAKFHRLVPQAAGNDGSWCRRFTPIG